MQALAFEDPWLASASGDGSIILLNVEAQLKAGPGARGLSSTCRQLSTPGGPAFCVDIGEQWLCCGSQSEQVGG